MNTGMRYNAGSFGGVGAVAMNEDMPPCPALRSQQELLWEFNNHAQCQQTQYYERVVNVFMCTGMMVSGAWAPVLLALNSEAVLLYMRLHNTDAAAFVVGVLAAGLLPFGVVFARGERWAQKAAAWLWRKNHAVHAAAQKNKMEQALADNDWSDPALSAVWNDAVDLAVLRPDELNALNVQMKTAPAAIQKQWYDILAQDKPVRRVQQKYLTHLLLHASEHQKTLLLLNAHTADHDAVKNKLLDDAHITKEEDRCVLVMR